MRILVVLPRFPYPLEKGDKLRAYHQLRQLAAGHEVHLLALSHSNVKDEHLAALRPHLGSITVVQLRPLACLLGILLFFLRGKPLQLGWWSSRKARRQCSRLLHQLKPDVLYCQMVRTLPTVQGANIPIVLDYQDALSLNLHRRGQHSPIPLRWMLGYESRALLRTEQRALRPLAATTIISPIDRDAIIANIPIAQTATPHLVPNGVDTPKPAVRALASTKVSVSGYMQDIRAAYRSADIFVAPMLIGSGMQNKLLEAMSMQLPCITTPIAATPLAGSPVLVASTPESLAHLIVSLIENPAARTLLGTQGRQYVLAHHAWPATVAPLADLLQQAALPAKSVQSE